MSVAASEIRSFADTVVTNIEKVIVGKRDAIELAIVALLCEGHILIEDVPGVGKTMLARSLAASLGCTFKRIQFTPDLLPNDVTGVSIFNQKTGEFEFRAGPVFANILLADEVNRATPRTQSSLLECMGERQSSIDGVTYQLPRPFLVLATQNPVEYEGTFPLPEAQLDRFLLRLQLGYPTFDDERAILSNLRRSHPIETLEQAVSVDQLQRFQREVTDVFVEDSVRDYIITLVHTTRKHPEIALGASPRGTLALYKTSQAYASLQGRDYVLPDDVQRLAPYVLGHRLILKPESQLRGHTADAVLASIIQSVDVPLSTRAG